MIVPTFEKAWNSLIPLNLYLEMMEDRDDELLERILESGGDRYFEEEDEN